MFSRTVFMEPGERVGRLVFTGEYVSVPDGKTKRTLGRFLCDCGNFTNKRIDQVKSAFFTGCGCQSPAKGWRKTQEKFGDDYKFQVLLTHLLYTASIREIDISLSIDNLKELYDSQSGTCYYTGQELYLPKNFTERELRVTNSASIDRLDPDCGYHASNVVYVLKIINMMKHRLNDQEFVSLSNEIVNNVDSQIDCKISAQYEDLLKRRELRQLKRAGRAAGVDYTYKLLLKRVKRREKHQQDLSVSDMRNQFELQGGLCAYTKQMLKLPACATDLYDPLCPSVDRIDSCVGYVRHNIQFVLKTVNFMKQSLSDYEFRLICQQIVSHRNSIKAL